MITLRKAQQTCCTEKLREWLAITGTSEKSLSAKEVIQRTIAIGDLTWCGSVARAAPDLSAEQRFALALESTPYWRGKVARHSPDLSAEQRIALAR